jgi:peptide chain release factor subunit 1
VQEFRHINFLEIYWDLIEMKIDEFTEEEFAVFKKKLKMLEKFKGRHTELITLYLPGDADRSSVMGQVSEEINQSANIKSAQTRKNVQGALRKIIVFLKKIDFKLPKKGLVVFSGNVAESDGRNDIRLFTVTPIKTLKTKLYWCDSAFHLDHLKDMLTPNEYYAVMTIDKGEATIAQLLGKKYEILTHFTSLVPGKTRAGGQSAQRFERLREEATQDFFKKAADKFNSYFLPNLDKVKGVIIGGPGQTKTYFMEKKVLHHELEKKVIGVVDTAYTNEGGIRELFQKSEDILKDTDLMKERTTLNNFLGELARNGLAIYGKDEVEKAIEENRVATLIISEAIPWTVFVKTCESCATDEAEVVKDTNLFDESKLRCSKCNSKVEITEEVDYLDYLIDKAKEIGAKIKIVGVETPEGKQFYEGFGGIGAILRYKL